MRPRSRVSPFSPSAQPGFPLPSRARGEGAGPRLGPCRRRHVAPRPGARPGPRPGPGARRPLPARRSDARAPRPPAGARLPLLAQRPPPAGRVGECGAGPGPGAAKAPSGLPDPAEPREPRKAGGAGRTSPGVGWRRSSAREAEARRGPKTGPPGSLTQRGGPVGKPGAGARRRDGRAPGSSARRCVTPGTSTRSGPSEQPAAPHLLASVAGTPLRKPSRCPRLRPVRNQPARRFTTPGSGPGWALRALARFPWRREGRPGLELPGGGRGGLRPADTGNSGEVGRRPPGLGEVGAAQCGVCSQTPPPGCRGRGREPSGVTSSPSSPSSLGSSRPAPAKLLPPSRNPHPGPSGLCLGDTTKPPAPSAGGAGDSVLGLLAGKGPGPGAAEAPSGAGEAR